LLVVIAIIAILAAMLFPVFARARESARKIQCLSNVKNIAMAVQMYLTDYDRLPPKEHRPEAIAYFTNEMPGGGSWDQNAWSTCERVNFANPYLRWAVVLDEYVKNRDVWRCPSAKTTNGAHWIVGAPNGDWLTYLVQNQGIWGRNGESADCSGGPCCVGWPPGWGGTVTDSISQGIKGGPDTGAFEQTVGVTGHPATGMRLGPDNCELKPSQVEDPSWFVVCGDAGTQIDIEYPCALAFPEICDIIGCGAPDCCGADWVNCPDTQSCAIDLRLKTKFWQDGQLRKPYARHMGGSNLGFMDGHAAWMAGDAIMAEVPSYAYPNGGHLRGAGTMLYPWEFMAGLGP